ncbi:aminopeptidase P family protein [Clostridium fermenticellae]|uniref:Aminopeptidase P family protein n=1 Tax=Clostridium fermenticellae TaxID=2068654 RepID=A0A386H4P9_9CLOT|nr:aminopeptidase P family protein [Clostridium fermenticellae]AYD40604.1 aminopeptidase P family protein [Clostridium fermenticellae]
MIEERIEKLKKLMLDNSMDAVLIFGDTNRNYLSGFTGNESFSLITQDKKFFITDSRFTEQAANQVIGYEILDYTNNGSFIKLLSDLVEKNNVKNLGFEEDVISYKTYEEYRNGLKCNLVPMNGIIEKIRTIKDNDELKLIRKAAEIADSAFDHIVKFIKPGMTEREIGIELEFYMKKLGAKGLSFPSIVASGVRSSLPHGEATDKVVSEGEFLTMDYGCIYKEYCSDMTRTVVIGKPSDKMVRVYDIVLEAQQRALNAYRANVPACDVDKVARDYISHMGYGKCFGHSLGHGVGRDIHESPVVSYRNSVKLEEGMVVTDEPGIYIPDFGGVRIEDLLVINENGVEVLSRSPKHLICIK